MEQEIDGSVNVITDLGVFTGHVINDDADELTLVGLEVRFAFLFETEVHHHSCQELQSEDRNISSLTLENLEYHGDDSQCNHLQTRFSAER